MTEKEGVNIGILELVIDVVLNTLRLGRRLEELSEWRPKTTASGLTGKLGVSL